MGKQNTVAAQQANEWTAEYLAAPNLEIRTFGTLLSRSLIRGGAVFSWSVALQVLQAATHGLEDPEVLPATSGFRENLFGIPVPDLDAP